ncbi:MAG: GntR family transcriptional regulator [Rubrimonas sp.]|uniref:GntR family transcriptional regulator n=1 Tax=Rubrimonas sp. TaxID=2036015 RepID=UPI002FDDF629
MAELATLRSLEPIVRPSVADTVFEELHRQIVALDLPPGAKLSEVEVARALGVSRQPVRDAFYRLSKLGFMTIRPQRATIVAPISETMVEQARFIRLAIEAETVRLACEKMTPERMAALAELIARQRAAVAADDRKGFHALDDAFHRELCAAAGQAHAWEVIRENKSHMDRVRLLSLAFASHEAVEDHQRIMDAVAARDADRAAEEMRRHLSRLKLQIRRIRAEQEAFFEGPPGDG